VRRVSIPKPGGYDRLVLESAPDPVPEAHEVLVRARAMGVNYADCITRMGLYASARKYVGYPLVPGFEFAGIVEAVGSKVDDVRPGARVVGVTRFGGYATALTVPRGQVFELPHGFSEEEAAGFPAVFLTAHYALFELAHVREGDWVLIHSAAGGVGTAALQLARLAGARVVAVVGRSDKIATAKKFGADVVIDKSSDDLWRMARRAAPQGFDVVLDPNGRETLRDSYRNLRPTGRLVVYGFHSMLPRAGNGKVRWGRLAWGLLRTPLFSPISMTNENKSVLAFNLSYLFEEASLLSRGMEQLLAFAREGKIQPLPVRTYRIEDVADAHRDLESGRTVGKLVLVP
jgi:NADPH:quinone reductase-like Zn-dependent oxidoreductase